MTSRGAAVLIVAAIGVAVAWYALRTPAPEPGSRAWQIREFRKDWTACGRFASKREEARRLLAWKPHPPWVNPPGTDAWKKEYDARLQQEAAESEANLKNQNARLAALSDRLEADELGCLQDLDWPDVQIQSLKAEIAEADKKKPAKFPWLRDTPSPR